MSRSYKKTPILKDNGKSAKLNKQIANRKIRRNSYMIIPKGNLYRKYTETWDINDQ